MEALKFFGCLPEDISTPFDKQAKARVAAEVSVARAVPIGADALAQEYRANPITADEKYKGKVLQVTGTITQIRAGSTGPFGSRPVVHLGSIRCEFRSNAMVQNLATGQSVTIRGKYESGGLIRYCMIRR